MASWNELFKTITVNEPDKVVTNFIETINKPGLKALDIGCGMGRHSIYLSKNNIDTYALDISEFALNKLNKISHNLELCIKTLNINMVNLPFNNNTFDIVLSIHVHNHGCYSEIKKSLFEAKRILKQNGYIILIAAPDTIAHKFINHTTTCIEKNTYIDLDLYDGDIPHHFFSHEEIEEIFNDFENIKLEYHTENSQWTPKSKIERLIYIGKK